MKNKLLVVCACAVLLSMTACGGDTDPAQIPEQNQTEIQAPETSSSEEKEGSEMRLNIQAGEHLLTATLAQNSSAEALVEMLSEGTVTIQMSDYANMEKVGSLPDSLPGK